MAPMRQIVQVRLHSKFTHTRITARVMRPFGRGLPHTLPFQAHPRVRLRSKKAAPAVATFFELRRTLRGAVRVRPKI